MGSKEAFKFMDSLDALLGPEDDLASGLQNSGEPGDMIYEPTGFSVDRRILDELLFRIDLCMPGFSWEYTDGGAVGKLVDVGPYRNIELRVKLTGRVEAEVGFWWEGFFVYDQPLYLNQGSVSFSMGEFFDRCYEGVCQYYGWVPYKGSFPVFGPEELVKNKYKNVRKVTITSDHTIPWQSISARFEEAVEGIRRSCAEIQHGAEGGYERTQIVRIGPSLVIIDDQEIPLWIPEEHRNNLMGVLDGRRFVVQDEYDLGDKIVFYMDSGRFNEGVIRSVSLSPFSDHLYSVLTDDGPLSYIIQTDDNCWRIVGKII